jgi:hypothetical protein
MHSYLVVSCSFLNGCVSVAEQQLVRQLSSRSALRAALHLFLKPLLVACQLQQLLHQQRRC